MLKSKLLTAAAVALTLSLGTVASLAVAQEPDKQTGKPDTAMMGGQSGTMGNPGGMMRLQTGPGICVGPGAEHYPRVGLVECDRA